MSLPFIVVLVLIVLLIGGLPTWRYHPYGWTPSGLVGVVLVVLLLLLLLGRL